MRNCKYQKLTIGGVDYSQYFRLPFMVQDALDESLGFAVVELINTPFKDPFKPFQDVVIGSGSTARTFITAQDEVEERLITRLYKHTITVIEITKETERIICGAKAFTNPLVRDYTEAQISARLITYTYSRMDGNDIIFKISDPDKEYPAENFKSPISGVSLPVYVNDLIDYDTYPTGTKSRLRIYFSGKNGGHSSLPYDYNYSKNEFKFVSGNLIHEVEITSGSEFEFFTPQTGEGIYTIDLQLGENIGYDYSGKLVNIYLAPEPVSKDPYTVEDVVLKLLDTSETLRVGLDSPRYQLRYQSTEQLEKFKKPAPEFRFSNGRSLWENLREVGRYVHAMPRIGVDKIAGYRYLFFDELGGSTYADLSKGRRIGGWGSFNIGDYTGGLESMASNLVNIDDESEGSITEPFGGGYVSMRVESEEARIQEGTGFIKTSHPIEKIISVEVGPFEFNGTTYQGGEIRPYVFEKSEYDILSSFSGSYPTSKTYALYYTQGSPNIQGLWYKAQDSLTEIFNAMEDYSISNVISAATGVPSGLLKSFQFTDLLFRVTYIPSVTARVRQYKPTYDGAFPSVMVHNQSANKLSSKAFGENLRGQLAMMGTTSDTVVYIFQCLEDVPKPGTLYNDEKYISTVSVRVYHDYVIAQIGLSTGYNELGGYVEINNAIRQFEIPGAEDRYTILEEFCEIGTKTEDDENLALTSAFKSEVFKAFSPQTVGKDVSLAIVKTYDEDGDVIPNTDIALPVISLSLGDSLYFGFRFADNFGAGSKSSAGGTDFRSQEYVRYGDRFYSQAHSVGFTLKSNPTVATSLSGKISTAHALPEAVGISGGTDMVSTGDHPILWHKDSADAGCFTYQLHFTTNDGLIIGDGLARNCAAVRTSPSGEAAYIYFYDHRINQLTGTTDTVNYVAYYAVKVDETNGRIYYTGSPGDFKSWAIIKGGQFMLGKNTTVRPVNIYFNFKRRMIKK